ncbi:hypothetical protein BDF19DRAFT_450781 [Syncephalis fuscata]|nr:hypothetical protein BDF19DRAFT_450781 [Syncephalis fuscata]
MYLKASLLQLVLLVFTTFINTRFHYHHAPIPINMRRHWCLLTAALKVCTLLSIASFAIASPLLTQINPSKF